MAGLLIARATERRKELAIRAALGASRGRLARQLLMELMLVAAVGGAGALALAFASAQLLSVFAIPAPIPQRIDLSPDWRLVAFTALLIVGAGLAAGLAPSDRLEGPAPRDDEGGLVGLASGSPLIFVGTAGILSAVAGVAFAGPMLRATRVAPAVTLKNETT